MLNKRYKIHFAILPARSVYNYVGPWDCYDDSSTIKRKEYKYYENKEWYDSLEEDVVINGYKNPIFIVAGELPPNDWRNMPLHGRRNRLTCNQLGGSRLFVGQKLELEIPCIISDFDGRFNNLKEIYHLSEINEYFTDPLENIIYSRWGLRVKTSPLYIADD